MSVKKIFCKLRNKLFLNAIRASVAEIVKNEIDPVKKALSEIFTIQLNGGGAVANLIHPDYGSENRGRLFYHRLLAPPHIVQQKSGGANLYVEHSDR